MKSVCVFLFFMVTGNVLFSQKTLSNVQDNSDIGIYEHLGKPVPGNLYFSNEKDSLVRLGDMITKPTVLSFVYFDCPGLCSPLLDGLSSAIEGTDLQLGKDYQVLTVSFNYHDTPAKAREKKETFLRRHSRNHSASWIYLTGDSASVYQLADAAGFKFRRVGKDFIHPAAIMVLSPSGIITRYLYGISFRPLDMRMAVIEAKNGVTRSTTDRVLNYCFAYNPQEKSYFLNITRVISIVAMLLFIGVTLIFVIIVVKRRKRLASGFHTWSKTI